MKSSPEMEAAMEAVLLLDLGELTMLDMFIAGRKVGLGNRPEPERKARACSMCGKKGHWAPKCPGRNEQPSVLVLDMMVLDQEQQDAAHVAEVVLP